MLFLCSLGLLVSSSSASQLYWALFSGHLFFGAENSERCLSQFSGKREVGKSESCLNQFSVKREVRVAGSISNLILVF